MYPKRQKRSVIVTEKMKLMVNFAIFNGFYFHCAGGPNSLSRHQNHQSGTHFYPGISLEQSRATTSEYPECILLTIFMDLYSVADSHPSSPSHSQVFETRLRYYVSLHCTRFGHDIVEISCTMSLFGPKEMLVNQILTLTDTTQMTLHI